ncbi:GGDEF domain-containing protein [Mycobacterium sp.]|uniref:GGDEF domain-containing protein n=1 Tax=Mycobacterium sp. TaxID=1785 RepID=UPI0025E171CB|nr:GGDEF domain-containing protein [Mycobacterium sp.]
MFFRGWFARWWNQPDQFETMTALLTQRGLLHSAQLLLAVTAAFAGVAPFIVVATSGRSSTPGVVASVVAAGFVFLSMGSFARRWPTRRQSVLLSTGGAVVITAWSMAQSDATLQCLVCAVMTIAGGYMAVFHTTRLMFLVFVLSGATATEAAIRLSHQADVTTAAASFSVLWLVNLAIPLGARGLSRAMTVYAFDSLHDPLTGLLNRRGIRHQFKSKINDVFVAGHTHLTVLLIDLDNFKAVNDTYGHPHGDELLLAVARLLRQTCPAHAAICRAGGEEFLIAYSSTDPGVPEIAPELCRAIAELPLAVTASIGSTTVASTGRGTHDSLDMLISTADAAMYVAKRHGGNQTHHILCQALR